METARCDTIGGIFGGKDAIRRALQTALPNEAFPHMMYSNLLINADFDWHGADAELNRAEQLP